MISLGSLLVLPAVEAQQESEPISPPDRRDLLGRPIPWGNEVDGQFVSLWMPYTRLLYGQPIGLRLETANPTGPPPYLRLRLDGRAQTAFLEWTTDDGEPVTFIPPLRGGYSGRGGNLKTFRLQPTGKYARGPFLVPGAYRVRVIVEAEWNPSDPIAWAGKVESNVVEFLVLDAQNGFQRVPESQRAGVLDLVKALDDPNSEQRDRAEQELIALGLDVLPLVENAIDSSSSEMQLRARRIVVRVTEPLFKRHSWLDRNAAAALLAMLGDSAWDTLGDVMEADRLEYWRVEAARYVAAPVLEERDPLPPDVVDQLVEALTNESPASRIIALRTIPPTQNERVLAALVDLLADPYRVYPQVMMPCCPSPKHMVADEARSYAIPWRGSSIIGPLVDLGRHSDNTRVLAFVLGCLQSIGPDPQSLEFVRALVSAGKDSGRSRAVMALGNLGSDAIPDLMRIAEDLSVHTSLRRTAIEEMIQFGEADSAGPFLMRMLDDAESEVVSAAIMVIDRWRMQAAAPKLRRLAEDARAEHTVRAWAIASYGRLADREDARELFVELLDSTNASARSSAVVVLGAIQCRECVPRILDALSDPEWIVRTQADRALRAVFMKPEGVGFEPAEPDATLWANWWADQH